MQPVFADYDCRLFVAILDQFPNCLSALVFWTKTMGGGGKKVLG